LRNSRCYPLAPLGTGPDGKALAVLKWQCMAAKPETFHSVATRSPFGRYHRQMISVGEYTVNTEKKASHRMFTFVGAIFAIGVVLAGVYFTILKPGNPDGQNITPPSGQSNQPTH
jgi:hypothetical protein